MPLHIQPMPTNGVEVLDQFRRGNMYGETGYWDNEYCHPVTILMMMKIAAGERVSSQAK